MTISLPLARSASVDATALVKDVSFSKIEHDKDKLAMPKLHPDNCVNSDEDSLVENDIRSEGRGGSEQEGDDEIPPPPQQRSSSGPTTLTSSLRALPPTRSINHSVSSSLPFKWLL